MKDEKLREYATNSVADVVKRGRKAECCPFEFLV